jgi:SDR family mycofactocin-dependent oxidoreductase
MARLDGKVALVTGAARGQGRAHALTLARNGADIIAVDIEDDVDSVPYPMARAGDLAETAKEVENLDRRVVAMRADVRSQEDLDAAVTAGLTELGRIDILIANAGIWSLAPYWELTEQSWNEMVDINLGGVWRAAKAVTPHMLERQSGAIVMTSSMNGLEPGMNFAHYTAAKHGVIGLMRTVALEGARHGIRCNAVCPGAIATPMHEWQGSYDMFAGHPGGTWADVEKGGKNYSLLKGTGMMSPQVIADAALWLVSDEAAKVTGIAVPVDAGHILMTGVNAEPVD